MLIYHGHTAVVYALAFSPDGGVLASGGKDGAVHLWGDGGQPATVGDGSPVQALAYLPDGRLAVGRADGWYVYRPGAEPESHFLELPSGRTTALAVIYPNLLAVGHGERYKPTTGGLVLWDLKRERRADPVFHEPNGVRAVAGCPAKGLVAWSTGYKKVTVRDIRRPDALHFTLTHTSPAVALSPDGATLAVALDWGVRLFDLAKKRERAALKGHKGAVAAVAFSPDGQTVATGSWDGTVRLWDAATGREAGGFAWPVGKVYSLAYAPDGGRLAAGGDTGAVVVWDVG
jgi:WD40 repeat protein